MCVCVRACVRACMSERVRACQSGRAAMWVRGGRFKNIEMLPALPRTNCNPPVSEEVLYECGVELIRIYNSNNTTVCVQVLYRTPIMP